MKKIFFLLATVIITVTASSQTSEQISKVCKDSCNSLIITKVSIADTATMLTPYLRTGTASNIYANSSHTHTSSNITDFTTTARNLITLTNVGSSGNATYTAATGVLNIPAYTASASPILINLTSVFSSSVTTLANVTDWSFAVTAGKIYRVTIIADYQTAATTTGGIMGVYLTGGGLGTIRGVARAGISQAAAATELTAAIRTISTSGIAGSFLTSTGVTVINSPHHFYMDIIFSCTNSGNFVVQWASEVAASASQLNAGSSLIYQQLN